MQNGSRFQNAWFVYRDCNSGNRRLLSTLSVAEGTCLGVGVNTCRTEPRRFRLAPVLHPGAAGRTYAAYGGVYVSVALVWLWFIDGQKPDRWDVVGVAITLIGMSIIAFAPRLK